MTTPSRTDYSALKDDLAHQSPEAISAMFSRVAARYDLMNHVLAGGLDLYWRSRLVRAVAAQRPARVLDLATGSGDVLLALAKQHAYTESAVGADFCLPMLQQARAKRAQNLLVGDGLQLPFPTASFDALTIAWGLRNFADRIAGLREMRRVLRPGGRAYILEFSHPVAWLAPLYFWYLRDVMPIYAQFITPERGAYEYLGDSIRALDQSQSRHRRTPYRRGLTCIMENRRSERPDCWANINAAPLESSLAAGTAPRGGREGR